MKLGICYLPSLPLPREEVLAKVPRRVHESAVPSPLVRTRLGEVLRLVAPLERREPEPRPHCIMGVQKLGVGARQAKSLVRSQQEEEKEEESGKGVGDGHGITDGIKRSKVCSFLELMRTRGHP